MPEYKEKKIKVEDHEVDMKIKGERAAEVGPQFVDHLKEFTSSSQESLD